MRDWLRLLCVGTALAATACTLQNESVPPDQLMSEFQAGKPVLSCRQDCALAWGNNAQKVANLDITAQWRDSALLVMQIGYESDLTYYYLGHAAENMGYLQAAETYYRTAERISVTDMSCHQAELNTQAILGVPVSACGGYVFPDALYPHLQVVEAELAAPSTPSPSPTHRKRVAHKPASTAAASSGGNSGFVVPAATAAPASGSGFVEPAPTASTAPASASGGFAVPPPASH
jgi:hypothetical protein